MPTRNTRRKLSEGHWSKSSVGFGTPTSHNLDASARTMCCVTGPFGQASRLRLLLDPNVVIAVEPFAVGPLVERRGGLLGALARPTPAGRRASGR